MDRDILIGRILRFHQMLEETTKTLEEATNIGVSDNISRIKTVRITMRCLDKFTKLQTDFFKSGFGLDDPNTGKAQNFLKNDMLYPPDYVLEVTLEQAMHDLEILLRSIGQRTKDVTPQSMQERLTLADKLAHLALQPTFSPETQQSQSPLLKIPTPLVYFDKSAIIRTFPYAPIAPIGIPLSISISPSSGNQDWGVPLNDSYRDLLTIPHETGHRIFWLGIIQQELKADTVGESLRELLSDETPYWVKEWLSEIFADVYSCLVAGPVVAHSIQNLMHKISPRWFQQDDGIHPTPMLRPFIYIDTLKALAESATNPTKTRLQNAAHALELEWCKTLKDLNIPDWIIVTNGNKVIKQNSARKHLQITIKKILGKLAEYGYDPKTKLQSDNTPQTIWSSGLDSCDQGFKALYEQTGHWINFHTAGVVLPELCEEGANKAKLISSHQFPTSFEIGKTLLPFEKLRECISAGGETPDSKPDEIDKFDPWWLQILVAGAWTDDPGPANVQPPK